MVTISYLWDLYQDIWTPWLCSLVQKNEDFKKCLTLLSNKKHFKWLIPSGLIDGTEPDAVIPSSLFFSSLFGMSLALGPSGHWIVRLVSFPTFFLPHRNFSMCIYSEVSVFNIVVNYIPFKVFGLIMVCLCFPNVEGTFPLIFSLENLWSFLQPLNLYNYNIIFYFSLQLLLFILHFLNFDWWHRSLFSPSSSSFVWEYCKAFLFSLIWTVWLAANVQNH